VAADGTGDRWEWDRDGYGGTVAVNTVVPGRSRELVITAVDLWSHAVQLRGVERIDHDAPYLRSTWRLTTDLGSTHSFHGGGSGGHSWEFVFTPPVPSGAKELRVFVGPARPPEMKLGDLPSEPTLTIAIPASLSVRRAPAVADADAVSSSTGFRADMEGSQVQPARVIPVSTTLLGAGDRDLCVLNIDARAEWFAVHVGGGGPLALGPTADTDDLSGRPSDRMLMQNWSATDDRDSDYVGSGCSSHSGFLWTVMATFTPALDPEARALTLTFPHPFSSGTVTSTVDLR
jgi:hypothetical protein